MNTLDFDPSKLGTKDHWDQRYAQELINFRENRFEGEVWFGEEPEEKMVEWAQTHVPPQSSPNILDIGSGNGHLLFAMVEAGYDASRLTGIDYSQGSVDLSASIGKQRELDDANDENAYGSVVFATCDFLDARSPIPSPKDQNTSDCAWDLILDKGTYDAISLMDNDAQGNAPLDKYPPRVAALLKPGGHFLITSCNFTEDELKERFAMPVFGLEYEDSIPYRKFTFGGKTGSSYATVAFTKQSVSSG
ncbi:S-adenosyl-L-methionine-dependent methyltransferase [Melanogaster broomeanus]|nr:S-adenosyl-L-methionine-dependent methyltransferase [Melanogaster broomeanus]